MRWPMRVLTVLGCIPLLFLAAAVTSDARAEGPGADARLECVTRSEALRGYDRVRARKMCEAADLERARQRAAVFAAEQREARERNSAAEEESAAKREAEYQTQRARWDAESVQAEQEESRAEELLRKKCGGDYMRVAVGMRWSRVRQCAGPFSLMGQVNGKRGVDSVYESPGGVVHVMGGRIVAWARK